MAAMITDPQQVWVEDDPNEYRIGYVASSDPDRPHRVALTTMPRDNTRNAAVSCTNMLRTFPGISCIVVTGVAGGVPSPNQPASHVRLGDVVVPVDGVIDYGHIRAGSAEPRRHLPDPAMDLLRAVRRLQTRAIEGESTPWERWLAPTRELQMSRYKRPPDKEDVLHIHGVKVPHPQAAKTGHTKGRPKVHFGKMGSADVLLKNEDLRDELAERHRVIAFEMEIAGVVASTQSHGVGWFMVRGVADYCNDDKTDTWHPYASLVAAGYLREILGECRPLPVRRTASRSDESAVLADNDLDRTSGVGAWWGSPAAAGHSRYANTSPQWDEKSGRRPAPTTRESIEAAGTRIGRFAGEPILSGDDVGVQPDPGRVPKDHASPLLPSGVPHPGEPPVVDDVEVVAALDPLVGLGQESEPTLWGDVPTRNPVFTGRQELLEQLNRRLRSSDVAAVLPQTLHGEGGVGKSQIAIEYAYRHRTEYDIIWWVPSERPAQILDSLTRLGERLGLDVGADVITALPRVREALRAGVPYPNWLLIFDNAEALESVRAYLPEAGTGKALITSRNRAWSEITETLEVDRFTRDESITLLRLRNPRLTEVDADRLAEALGDLPLAIEHGSAWLASTGMAADDYLTLLSRKHAELTGQAQSSGNEMPVAVVTNVVLDRLAQENPAAVQLLEICSFFAPEPISRELFIASRGTQTFADLDAALKDPTTFNRAIRDIQRYRLATIDHRAKTIQLHRLVQIVLQSRISIEQRDAVEHGAHVVLAGGRPGDPADRNHWKQYQALTSHLTTSRAVTCEDDWTRGLVLLLIEFYFYWGDYVTGRALAQDAVECWQSMPAVGRDHRQTLKAAKWLGYYLQTDGKFRDAAAILHDTLERYRRTFGADDDGTLDAMTQVASAHRASGRLADALRLDQEAYDRARQIYREDDPDTLRAAHSLGISLRLIGTVQDARRLDRDTYLRRRTKLGEDHPETLRTLNGLTIDERECGNYLRAHRMTEALYRRYVALFGLAHPDTIKVARNLAVARRRGGDYDGAFKLAEDTVNRFRERFGATHPETIAATLNLAVDIRETGDLARAEHLATQAVEEYRNALGPDHPHTLNARTSLGIVLRLLGKPEEAYTHSHAAWTALTDQLGSANVLTLTFAVNHASNLSALGDHDGAYELDTDTLTQLRSLVGAEHPSTLACQLNIALDLVALGRTDDTEVLFEGTIQAFQGVVGDGHPAVAAARYRARANCDVDPMPL